MPVNVLEDYKMKNITLEYRRECRQSNVLESLTSMKPITQQQQEEDAQHLECTSLLRMEGSHADIVRARSLWHSKKQISPSLWFNQLQTYYSYYCVCKLRFLEDFVWSNLSLY